MDSLPLGKLQSASSHDSETVSFRGLSASGFRPLFFAAALSAVLTVPLWLFALSGSASLGTAYLQPMSWHAHEMVFGYASAVVAGFLLTAVKNWTGRETATGGFLYGVVFLWFLGRLVLLAGASLPKPLVAIVDLAFVPAIAVAIGRPIVASNNKRNFVMLAVLGALFAANLAVHLDALGIFAGGTGWQLRGSHAGVDILVLLCVIIRGRVVPMFTRNGASSKTVVSVPALDTAATVAVAAYAIFDVSAVSSRASCIAAAVGSLILVARSVRWGSISALSHPLLWILHFGHAWIIVGLGLRAASIVFVSIPQAAATHALTVGAIGSLTLGMMARVSLGHTGRSLHVGPVTVVGFAAITLAALLRVVGSFISPVRASYLTVLEASGALWSIAYALYVVAYAKILFTPRVDGKPG